MTNELVNIVIPLYQAEISDDEAIALQRCCKILKAYPITFVKPQSLNLENLACKYPEISIESFADSFFADIYGYNKLMMSTEFYNRFRQFQYVLVYQLDAYVFSDKLSDWCAKGYDYIGAPWFLRPAYQKWPVLLSFKNLFYRFKTKPNKAKILGNKVGNGGFSLRKVSAHIAAIQSHTALIADFLKRSEHHTEFNEDAFWATQISQLNIPSYKEAALFAFDLHPERGMIYTKGILPFGCHGWSKTGRRDFWKTYIEEIKS